MRNVKAGLTMREPQFWWHPNGVASYLLQPFGFIYGWIASRRLAKCGSRVECPVICIGNFTVGGAGKTPAALAVARILIAAGEHPFFLSRGYGGRICGPLVVDPALHRAIDVGDEPLLLARIAPTVVSRNRVFGAQMAKEAGASVVIMDDGFQNPSLHKDIAVLVIDARRDVGNGRVVPAGPLRAPIVAQLAHVDILLVVGSIASALEPRAHARNIPIVRATLRPDEEVVGALGTRHVLAFAGIGDPSKFFETLRGAGIQVDKVRAFADHHRYRLEQARELCRIADRDGLILVTTEKDRARLDGASNMEELFSRAVALPITLAFDDEHEFGRLLMDQIDRARVSKAGSV
jgi:tetraacyldisaccharide 4'-kinase